MFANLRNKTFVDVSNNEVLRVNDQSEDIVTLDNGQKVSVQRLLDRGFYEEHIDPNTFLNALKVPRYQITEEKEISDYKPIDRNDDSIIMEYDPEEEKRMLLEKASKMLQNSPNADSQINKFREILGDDEDLPPIVSQVTVSNDVVEHRVPQPQVKQVVVEDPIVTMFRNVKRNNEFKISIDIINKIPRPDFIEMMEDSYQYSIIDHLAKEFTKSLFEDPSFIEDKIREEIKTIVYGKAETKSKPKRRSTTTRKKVDKEEIEKND